jgi:serine/threonine protein kinase
VAVGDDHAWLEKVLSEVNLLRMLSHRNLVRYNHVWLESSSLSSFGPIVPCAFILQEFCDGGTLEDFMRIKDNVGPTSSKRDRIRRMSQQSSLIDDDVVQLSMRQILCFMRDITAGVQYLHQNQIIHRDLKPSNCLLVKSSVTGDLPTVLVSDFGEGQLEGLYRAGSGSTGTLEYCAPELINRVNGQLAQFSKKTDIFSLGMILHYLCFSRLPYSNVWQEKGDLEALTGEVQRFAGFNIDVSNTKFGRTDLPRELCALLARMVSINPDERPCADEVLTYVERGLNSPHVEPLYNQLRVRSSVELAPSPPVASSRLLPPPPSTPPLPTVGQWDSRTRMLLVKSALIAVKAVSLYQMGVSPYSQLLTLMAGIEVPFMSTRTSVGFFLAHWAVVWISKTTINT